MLIQQNLYLKNRILFQLKSHWFDAVITLSNNWAAEHLSNYATNILNDYKIPTIADMAAHEK